MRLRPHHLALAVTPWLLLSGPCQAYDDLADCAAIEDGTKRLACYDELAGRNPGESRLAPTTGKWITLNTISKVNDRPTISIVLPAEDQPNDGLPVYAKPRLILSCENGETDAFVVTRRLLSLSSDGLDVLFGVDDGPSRREIWQVSSDGRRIFQPRPIPWIKQLLTASRLDVKIIIYGTDSLSYRFDLKGVDLAVQPLRKLCGW